MSQSLNNSEQDRLRLLIQQHKQRTQERKSASPAPSILQPATLLKSTDKYGKEISLNEKQASFVNLAASGQSAVLIGAAGTGKTTTQREVCNALIASGRAGLLDSQGHKHLRSGTPGIVICAFTRRAVANIKRNLPADLQANALTIHALLEYQPTYEDITDPETGDTRTRLRFAPNRDEYNPLPPSIRTIIFEESSMIGTDLHNQVIKACPHNPQIIYLGDIQQLPPVFGPATLGFKLNTLPVVELTEVYRQALESPIIKLAHRILSGKGIPASELSSWNVQDKLKLHPWKKKIDALSALSTAALFFQAAYDQGPQVYDPEEDIILLPFNKGFGTDELNKHIANHLAKDRKALIYEVISGFKKLYFHVGEKILFDKEDAVIEEIYPNPAYVGAKPSAASRTMDYWGHDSASAPAPESLGSGDVDVDFLLAQVASGDTEDGIETRATSHVLRVRMLDTDEVVTIDRSGDMNSILLGYAITVHKSQGSEWRKVFLCIHQSHSVMVQRELLYTAVTRAKESLYVICEPDTFVKGIENSRIKGVTLQEKAEYFKGKYSEGTVIL